MHYCTIMQNKLKVFEALSSEQRLKIVQGLLEHGDFKCYCQFEDVIEKDLSVVYRHFSKLEEIGIIETRKRGKKLEGRVKKPDKVRKILKIVEEIKNES